MKILEGICGSAGYGCGAAVVKRTSAAAPDKYAIEDPAGEERRFRDAQTVCEANINKLLENPDSLSSEVVEIFNAYLTILHDEVFFKKPLGRLEPEKVNIEYLLYEECRNVVAKFESFDDPYLKERAVDIENVCNELIRVMLGQEQDFTAEKTAGTDIVVVADDLTPVETMKMDKSRLQGFVTEKGGVTSHTVILAKALGIPAIIGVKGAVDAVADGSFLLLDASSGTVTIDPAPEQKDAFKSRADSFKVKLGIYEQAAGKEAVTLDGFKVDVNVNTGDTESIKSFDPAKCDGIGLLRTEFLYMDCDAYPDEEAQYEVYKDAAVKAEGKEVIIRTLDVGGDKQIGYMNLPAEENPFLGYRAIRLCLDRRDVFLTQLRAILRASAHGNVKIMFPMLVTMEELLDAKSCVEEAKRSLADEGIPFNQGIQTGIMVETPAAALITGRLAAEADFFSVGSNDLIQYITAADRMNTRVRYLYDSCNLSVLNAVRMTAESAATASIPWGICGEVASEDRLVPVWAALGASELSVAPSSVGRIKHLIRRIDRTKLKPEIDAIFDMNTIVEVKKALDDILARLES